MIGGRIMYKTISICGIFNNFALIDIGKSFKAWDLIVDELFNFRKKLDRLGTNTTQNIGSVIRNEKCFCHNKYGS